MSADIEDRTAAGLDAEDVRSFLLANPDFVREDAELFELLARQPQSEGIIDLSAVARGKLVEELRQLRSLNDSIVETARANLATQSQIHAAVLALLETQSLESLDQKIAKRLTGAIGVDACAVLVEGVEAGAGGQSLRGIEDGFVSAILGQQVERLGPVEPDQARLIYGDTPDAMHSQALIRLDFHGHDGLFAIGSRDPQLFQLGQGTELLNFLARCVERLILRWMPHPDH